VAYAKDRLQMRASGRREDIPIKPADPDHRPPRRAPDAAHRKIHHRRVPRLILLGRYESRYFHSRHPDENEKQAADDLVALLTPIVKAYQTDMGFQIASDMMQVYGGHGYIWEWGVEQYARDARIAMIYEGTNGIQALDLVGRKMGANMGRYLRRFFHPVSKFIEDHQADADMQEFIFPLAKSFAKLQQATALIAQKGLKDPNEAGAASSDYLRQFALVALAFMWCRMAKVSLGKLAKNEGDKAFHESKLKTARFFMERVLPETESRFKMLQAGAKSMMNVAEAEF
jgi:hypothetical protein